MMQFIKTLLRREIILGREIISRWKIILGAALFFLPAASFCQSTFLPQGSPYDHFLDRMQILQQTNPTLNFSSDRPISRKIAVRMAEMADSLNKRYPYDEYYYLSAVDRATLRSLLVNNIEWTRMNK